MNVLQGILVVGSVVGLGALGVGAAVANDVRRWAIRTTGRRWTFRLGLLGGVVLAVAAGAFSTSPPLAVFLLAVAGLVGFVVGVLSTAGAVADTVAALPADASFARQVRTFWYVACTGFRGTRWGFLLALVGWILAAMAGGIAVDPVVNAVGNLTLGGVFACVLALAVVGVFVPGNRTRSVPEYDA
jgi:hypothetical protein